MDEIFSLPEAKDEERVGSKAASLAKVSDVGKIPQGFVVSNDSFRRFLENNGIKDKILSVLARTQIEDKSQVEEASRKIKDLFENVRISQDLREKIQEAYKNFVISSEAKKAGEKAMELIKAGREKPPVAVRASPTRDRNSSAGIYRSKLNVKGDENLLEEVKEVWKSFYSPEAIYYREKRGYGHDVAFGVQIQKMVEADKSVAFLERNPADSDEFVLEGVHGLGEILSKGEVVPDLYIFDKESSKLKERKVADKQWIQTRNPSTGEIERQTIQGSKKNSEVLERGEINRITSEAFKITSRFGFNALLEFCLKNGEVFLLDVSPIHEPNGRKEEQTGEVLMKGLGVSPGHFSGEITRGNKDLERKVFLAKKFPQKKMLFNSPGAVISDTGGFSSNGARMARELGIPGIVRTDSQKSSLREGRRISLDGFRGEIRAREESIFEEPFKGRSRASPTTGLSEQVTATEIMASLSPDQVGEVELEEISGAVLDLQDTSFRSPRFFDRSGREILRESANLTREVWARTDLSESSPDIVETLKKMHRSGEQNIHILFDVPTIEDLKSVDKQFNLPPTVQKGLVVETPILALSAEQICSKDIDLILINFDELTDGMLGWKGKEGNVINSTPFWEVIENLCRKCRENGIKVCVQKGLERRALKKFVERGIDSVLVGPESVDQARRALARVEKKLLLEKMR